MYIHIHAHTRILYRYLYIQCLEINHGVLSYRSLWECESMQKGMYVLSGFETNLESRHLRFINISHFSQLRPDFLFHSYS